MIIKTFVVYSKPRKVRLVRRTRKRKKVKEKKRKNKDKKRDCIST